MKKFVTIHLTDFFWDSLTKNASWRNLSLFIWLTSFEIHWLKMRHEEICHYSFDWLLLRSLEFSWHCMVLRLLAPHCSPKPLVRRHAHVHSCTCLHLLTPLHTVHDSLVTLVSTQTHLHVCLYSRMHTHVLSLSLCKQPLGLLLSVCTGQVQAESL